MEIRAVLKFVRVSPRKVAILVDTIKGQSVENGLNKLRFMPQKAAKILEKIVKSALANADQNPDIDVDSLVIKTITANQGPMLKRFRAKARGRGTRILKRTSHITVILADESA